MSLYQASKINSKKKKKSSHVTGKRNNVTSPRLKNSSTTSIDLTDSSVIKQLRREKEREQLMRLKTNQKLALLEKLFSSKLKAMNVKLDDITDVKFDELQKRLQQTEAVEGKMTAQLDKLQRENAYLKKKQKKMTRTSPMSPKTLKLIKNNMDEKSRNILTSHDSQQLFEGIILEYSRKHKTYQQRRWCKLTNDGELLFFKTKNATNATKKIDLISVYNDINKSTETEFELVSNSATKDNRKFRTETKQDVDEWVKYIKIVQYYFKVKSQQNINDDSDSKEMKFEYETIEIEEKKKVKETETETETDPFWLDISCKMDEMDYKKIKKIIPAKDEISPADKKKWKETFWKAEYGEFELSCSVQLVCYDTGQWTDDESDILFASVSKYGVNSYSSWSKIAENLNREVSAVMKKYSKLVGVPVKHLKKMSVARG